MQLSKLVCIALMFLASAASAQSPVTKIVEMNEVYYITTQIEYPVTGLYQYENVKEPIIQLNADGTGLFQLHGMSKTPMVWGIECDSTGKPKREIYPAGSKYMLWYKITEKHKGPTWESGTVGKWDVAALGVYLEEKQIRILGERIKSL